MPAGRRYRKKLQPGPDNIPRPTQIEEKRNETDRYIRCRICLNYLRNPRLCPHCYVAACQKCFIHWLTGLNRSSVQLNSCFECKQSITVDQIKKCPPLEKFVAEIMRLKVYLRNEKFMLKKRIEMGKRLHPPAIPEVQVSALMNITDSALMNTQHL